MDTKLLLKFCKPCNAETEHYLTGAQQCKPCKLRYARTYRATHIEAVKASQKRYREANRERSNTRCRAWYAANKDRQRAYDKQRGDQRIVRMRKYAGLPEPTRPEPELCELCGGWAATRMHLDHDHKTDTFRGWLCGPCNLGLGHFYDDPARLRQAIAYLERNKQ